MRHPGLLALSLLALSCGGPAQEATVLKISGSAVGAEGEILARQIARFQAARPGGRVEVQQTPDDATQRHQLYVQWLQVPWGQILAAAVVATAPVALLVLAFREGSCRG